MSVCDALQGEPLTLDAPTSPCHRPEAQDAKDCPAVVAADPRDTVQVADEERVNEYLLANPDLERHRSCINPALARLLKASNDLVVLPEKWFAEAETELSFYEKERLASMYNNDAKLISMGIVEGDARFLTFAKRNVTSFRDEMDDAKRARAERMKQKRQTSRATASFAAHVPVLRVTRQATRTATKGSASSLPGSSVDGPEGAKAEEEEEDAALAREWKASLAQRDDRKRVATSACDSRPPKMLRTCDALTRYLSAQRSRLTELPWFSDDDVRNGIFCHKVTSEPVTVQDMPQLVRDALRDIMADLKTHKPGKFQNTNYRPREDSFETLRSVDDPDVGFVRNVFLGKTSTSEMGALMNAASRVDRDLGIRESMQMWIDWLLDGGETNARVWLEKVGDAPAATEVILW